MNKHLEETRNEAAKAALCLVDAQSWAIWATEKMITHIAEALEHAQKSLDIAKSLE